MAEQEDNVAVVCHTPFKNRMLVFELGREEGEELLRQLEDDERKKVLKVVPLPAGGDGTRGWQVIL